MRDTVARKRASGTRRNMGSLVAHFCIETRGIDHEALVPAHGYPVDAIVRFDMELELPAFNFLQTHVYRRRESRRGGRLVGEAYVRSQSLFLRPVKMRTQRLDARPFHQSDHETGSEYRRHLSEHARFRI